MLLKKIATKLARRLGYNVVKFRNTPVEAVFHLPGYLRHNARRLEHLASLRISVRGYSVLEVGAGIGDHSHYYIDRGCTITITEARKENLDYLRKLYADRDIQFLDMEKPAPLANSPFDIVHCYGLLYHLSNPQQALSYISQNCKHLLFLETCVSFGDHLNINPVKENINLASQAFSGTGCRPTRPWLFTELKKHFEYVYIPRTQPNHPEFPLDWESPESHQGLSRAIFIGSRERIENEMLSTELLMKQVRHE
jgi:SAM-dependent methyltransferase